MRIPGWLHLPEPGTRHLVSAAVLCFCAFLLLQGSYASAGVLVLALLLVKVHSNGGAIARPRGRVVFGKVQAVA